MSVWEQAGRGASSSTGQQVLVGSLGCCGLLLEEQLQQRLPKRWHIPRLQYHRAAAAGR